MLNLGQQPMKSHCLYPVKVLSDHVEGSTFSKRRMSGLDGGVYHLWRHGARLEAPELAGSWSGDQGFA